MEFNEKVSIEVPAEQEELLRIVSKAITEGDRSTLEYCVHTARSAANTKKMLKQMEDGTYKETLYMEKEEIDTAYKYVLNSEKTPSVKECFEEVITSHNVSPEYIEESKSRPNKHLKDVVRNNKEHPVVKRMEVNKVFDVEVLYKSTTPNQLLVNLTTRRSISDRLDKLEAKVEDLELRTSIAEARQDSTDVILTDLLNPKGHKQRIAKGLRDRGVNIKEIAKTLEVDQRTIKRWLSPLKIMPPQ